ncbi:MAG: hypothetical protein WCH04_20975 [Gammaproteobacteria bacterium]
MFTKKLISVVLTGLLFASQSVLSEEPVVQPEQGEVAAVVTVEAVDPGQVQETAAPAAGMQTDEPGMTVDEPGSADKSEGMAMQPGMMGPGKKGCRMGKGGMGGMGKGGMKGMMPGGMGEGCKTGGCMSHSGITKKQYRELMGRLDVLDARMAKIDAMLERLLAR